MLALKIKKLIIWGALGHSLMVELRTLTAHMLHNKKIPVFRIIQIESRAKMAI